MLPGKLRQGLLIGTTMTIVALAVWSKLSGGTSIRIPFAITTMILIAALLDRVVALMRTGKIDSAGKMPIYRSESPKAYYFVCTVEILILLCAFATMVLLLAAGSR